MDNNQRNLGLLEEYETNLEPNAAIGNKIITNSAITQLQLIKSEYFFYHLIAQFECVDFI